MATTAKTDPFAGMLVCEAYQLPGYPYDISDQPTHPRYTIAMWDKAFMQQTGCNWCEFYGALVELSTGHNPNRSVVL